MRVYLKLFINVFFIMIHYERMDKRFKYNSNFLYYLVVNRLLLWPALFFLVIPIAFSLTIIPIYPKNNTTISQDSIWFNISTNRYASCSYSLDSNSYDTFSSSTADRWNVNTATKTLDLSEDVILGTNRETIRNITTFIDDSELAGLADDQVTNSKNTSSYHQYLYTSGPGMGLSSGYVFYTEDPTDVTADFLYYKSGAEIGRYLLEFVTPLQSDIYNSSHAISTTGLHLTDFENVDINFLSKSYKIVKARRTSSAGNNIELIFMSNAVNDTLLEGNTKTYKIQDKKYNVTLDFVDAIQTKFTINAQTIPLLTKSQFYVLSDSTSIYVSDILYQDFAGGIHSATFYFGRDKTELQDANIQDVDSTNFLIVNNNTIDNAHVIIEGTDNNNTFKINRIHVNMTAEDDFFIPAGKRLSENPDMDEPEALFTSNWDILYKGLAEQEIETIELLTSGSSKYRLKFKDADGNQVSLPLAEAVSAGVLQFGEKDKALINEENKSIEKDDYIILTDATQNRGKRKTYALQYKGADKITVDNPVIKFLNLGSGETIEQMYSAALPGDIVGPDGVKLSELAVLKFGGTDFKLYNLTSILSNDFNLAIDLNADGAISVDRRFLKVPNQINITTFNGMEIGIQNGSGNWIDAYNISKGLEGSIIVSFKTPDNYRDGENTEDKVQTLQATDYVVKISSDNESKISIVLLVDYTFGQGGTALIERTSDGETNVQYTYTSYGAFITRTSPANEPGTIKIDYPKKQREALVYYENGGMHSKFLSNISEGQHSIKITCDDIFGILNNYSLEFSFNAIGNEEDENTNVKEEVEINKSTLPPAIAWNKTLGSYPTNFALQTKDGGYIVPVKDNHTFVSFLKLDSDGNVLWNKPLGDVSGNVHSILETPEGGYIFSGNLMTGNFTGSNITPLLLLKTDGSGNIEWNRTIDTGNTFYSLKHTSDGGYILIGKNGANFSTFDFWAIKTDSTGHEEWNKTFDTGDSDFPEFVGQTSDGGYFIGGSSIGDTKKIWILKTDSGGVHLWNITISESHRELSITNTLDGGFVIARDTRYESSDDFLLIKFDSKGNPEWNKTFDGVKIIKNSWDYPTSVQQTNDGGYILAGYRLAYSCISDPQHDPCGWYDTWIVKTDSKGNAEWNKTIGSFDYNHEKAYSIQQTSDGGYIIAGEISEQLPSEARGIQQGWIVRLKMILTINSNFPQNGSNNVNINSNIRANFSANLSQLSIKDGIIVSELSGKKVDGRVNYNDRINQLVFDPFLPLKYNKIYMISITDKIKDNLGNSIGENYTWNFTTGLRDTDNDGIPDSDDIDDDNDGIEDSQDFFIGNSSSINSDFQNLSFAIGDYDNISGILNGTQRIKFRMGHQNLLEFDFDFSLNTILDLANISILNASNSTTGAIVISGLKLPEGFTKKVYMEKLNSSINGICIKDAEISWVSEISDSCSGADEFKVECDGTVQSSYKCTYNATSNLYQITGLKHSGAKQIGYSKPSSSSDGSEGSGSGGSGGGGGGSGGGGGGGGSGLSYICNMDWFCTPWSECENGWETRRCDFVKVAQHAQESECPSSSNSPETARKCQEKESALELKQPAESSEESKPQEISANESSMAGITGKAIADTKGTRNPLIFGLIAFLILVAGIFIYVRIFLPKNKLI